MLTIFDVMHLVLQVKVINELRMQVTDLTTQLTDVKKELMIKKKMVATLTTERDALKAKKSPAVVSAAEVKELARLREVRSRPLRTKICCCSRFSSSKTACKRTAEHVPLSASATADAVAIAA